MRRSLRCEQLEDRRLLAAVNDAYSMFEDSVLKIIQPGVLLNDTPSGMKATVDGEPVGGTVELDEQGGFIFVANPDFFGKASFSYKAESDGVEPTTAKVTIDVKPVEDEPRGADDSYVTEMNLKLTVSKGKGILANDVEPDHQPLVMTLVDNVTHGKLDLKADGSFVYIPENDYLGFDLFTYTISDGNSTVGPFSANVQIIIPQTIRAKADTFATNEDEVLRVTAPGLLENDLGVDLPLQARMVEGPAVGVVDLQDDGSFAFTSPPNFNGQVSFTYRAYDLTPEGAINRLSGITKVTIDVAPVNDLPTGKPDSYEVNVNRPLVVGQVRGLARPWVGNGHYYEWVERPGTWAEAKSFAESQSLQGVAGQLATVTSLPELRFLTENFPAHSGWLGATRDPAAGEDELTLGWSWVTEEDWDLTNWDAAQPDPPAGALEVALATNELGVPYKWEAVDARQELPFVLIEYPVGKVPDGPLTNDRDIDGDVVSFARIDKPPEHGSVRMSTNGYFEYLPNLGFYGTDSFTYFANDGFADEEGSTKITIGVLPIPELAGDFDFDDKVSLADFGILKQHFGQSGDATLGDASGDAKIDLADFGLLKRNFGRAIDPPVALPAEPSSAAPPRTAANLPAPDGTLQDALLALAMQALETDDE
ncbi:MAG: Ig-like domain-containing protein [Pirellulales bacterium]